MALPTPSWCLVGAFAMRSPLWVESFSDLDWNEDSSSTFPRVLVPSLRDGVTRLGSCCVFLRTRSERRLVPSTYPSLLRDGVTLRVECGFLLTRSERSLLWIAGRYSFRMGSPFSGQVITIWSPGKEFLELGSWERGFRTVLGISFVILWSTGLLWSRGGSHILLSSLLARTLFVSLSPTKEWVLPFFFFWPCCLSPSPGDRSASAASRCFISPGCFHVLVFHAWWLASGTSGSRTSRNGLLAYCQGASDSLPHPSPGREVEAFGFGIAVRTLLQATSLQRCMESSASRARDCPSLPLRVATLSLKLSRPEVPGPPVLLSYYVACVIYRGPGALSSFVTLPGLSLWSFRTGLGLRGAPSDIWRACFLVRKALFILASASAELDGVFHAMSFRGSHSGGWGEVSFSFVPGFVAKIQGPPPFLLGLRASLYRPTQTRDNRNGRLLYPVLAVRCSLVRLGCALLVMQAVPFCRRV